MTVMLLMMRMFEVKSQRYMYDVPVPTLPRSGGRQLVCLDSVDFVINSYTYDIPEGVRLVSKKLE